MSNEFFVDVVSNASMDVYPDNTLSAFVNRLPQDLDLEGEWTVAIHEIIYPLSYKPAKRKTYWNFISEKSNDTVRYDFEYMENEKIEPLIKRLNADIATNLWFENQEIAPDEILKHTPKFGSIKVKEEGKEKEKLTLKFGSIPGFKSPVIFNCKDHTFMRSLGFDMYTFEEKVADANRLNLSEITAPYQPDTSPKSHLVFVYSDIIHEHYVGDSFLRVLRVLPLNKAQGDGLHHVTFTTPYYYPVRMNRIKDIGIKICNEEGESIKFKSGRVFISLHFRKAI